MLKVFCVSLFFACAAIPAGASSRTFPLDTTKIRDLYLGGDFDQALAALETFLSRAKSFPKSDSIFVYKHLGVMYAANDATKEKGKYYLYHLLGVEMDASLVDMFASDQIYSMFKTLQEEFSARNRGRRGSASAATSADTGKSAQAGFAATGKPASGAKWYWFAGGVAAAGLGYISYTLMQDPKPGAETVFHATEPK